MSKKELLKVALFFALALVLDQGFKLLCLELQTSISNQSFESIITHLQAGYAYAGLFQSEFIDLRLVLNKGVAFSMFSFFVWDGVVDMFFWHKWFNFAIFNVADVIINLSVAMILINELFLKKKLKS